MILTLGDIHGNFKHVLWDLKLKGITNCSIIQVGDFGVGFIDSNADMKNLENFSKELGKLDIKMYAIRGNHDNPAYFDGTWKFQNLELLPDYSVLELEGDKYALIGGAISIDRKPRIAEMLEYAKYNIHKESYWYDELFVFDSKKASKIKDCKYVITHTAPDFCWPDNKNGFGSLVEHFIKLGDKKLSNDLRNERNELTKLYNTLKGNNPIKDWFYGHFHRSELTVHDNINFRLLGINELFEIRNDR